MQRSRGLYLPLSAIFLISFFVAGCVTHFGYGRVQLVQHEKTIDELVNNWRNYNVSYSGLGVNQPSAVMFEPKFDEREVVTNNWRPVRDKETLEELVRWLKNNTLYRPRLRRILGPDQVLYAYVYTGWDRVVARAVEPRVMRVLDLPAPLPDDFLVTSP